MHIGLQTQSRRPGSRAGFSLVEAVIALAVIGILLVTLYSGMTSGLDCVRISREQLRATQIMLEKMEAIRVFNWDQITTNGFLPTSFLEPYAYDGTTNPTAGGFAYTGAVTVAAVPASGRNYTNHLRQVTVALTWNSGKGLKQREISTYVSRYGIQNKLFY